MGVADKTREYNKFVQKSFRNSVTSVQKVHQTMAEIQVDMLQIGGLPEDWGEKMKTTHGNFIDIIYSSVVDAYGELGQLIVNQVENMYELADDFGFNDEDG